MRYDVFRHYFGRRTVRSGPAAGCLGFEEHSHEKVNVRQVSLNKAKMLANGCTCHAQVVEAMTSRVVYENGKEPGLAEGMVRA